MSKTIGIRLNEEELQQLEAIKKGMLNVVKPLKITDSDVIRIALLRTYELMRIEQDEK